jgi:hypothetical protein
MGVHDEVGAYPALAEGEVLLLDDDAHDALLAVAGGELVAELGAAGVADQDLEHLLLLLVGCVG